MKEKINLFLRRIKKMPDFNRVKFVILFGSYSQNMQNKLSDIDFAVYYDGNSSQRFKFRMKLLGKLSDDFDVQIFQDLPLNVRIETLKGEIIYCKDMDFLYETAYKTLRDYDDFKKAYYDYINLRRTKIK